MVVSDNAVVSVVAVSDDVVAVVVVVDSHHLEVLVVAVVVDIDLKIEQSILSVFFKKPFSICLLCFQK